MSLLIQPIKDKIAMRLFRWVMLSTLIAGGLLSLTQIALDADRARKEIDRNVEEFLEVVREPATQAIYSLDPELAEQVLTGLFEMPAVRYASIGHPDETLLAHRSRALLKTNTRWITDPVFKKERQYSIHLIKNFPAPTYYGDLTVTVDTTYAASEFLARAWIVFISGVIRASILGAILFLICHLLITRPLLEMIYQILKINPAEPGYKKLYTPTKHNDDEFGVLVQTTNQFLDEIALAQKRRQAAESRVLKLSQYDPLTGLPNRLLFQNQLKNALLDAEKLNQRIAVLCLGIDDFKAINDQYSYTSGDKILQEYCERFREDYGLPLVASRLGGDQFALFAYNASSTYTTIKLVETLLANLSKPFTIGEDTIQVNTTVGVTLFPDDEQDTDLLLQKAEQTMNFAKSMGKNHYKFYVANIDNEIREKRGLAKDLAKALENNELFVVYQPQVNLTSGTISGAEALLRWAHPEKGLIPPDIFIPIAEQEGTIQTIGVWVLHQVCSDLKSWLGMQIDLRVAVNFSPVQLKDNSLERVILEAMNRYGVSPKHLEIEVTETAFMENMKDASSKLQNIRKMGISTSVDDFGTGYSSLSYLKQLPINNLKIDRQFVMDLVTDREDSCLVDAIVQMGKSLKMEVIAEGVENEEQLLYLQNCHCDYAQGYYFSKPLPKDEFLDFVQDFQGISTLKDNMRA